VHFPMRWLLVCGLVAIWGHLAGSWATRDGTFVHVEFEHPASVTATAWSPCGAWVATATTNGVVRIWNSTSGQILWKLSRHKQPVTSVGWSFDGQWFLSSSWDSRVVVWNATSWKATKTFKQHQGAVTSAVWHPSELLVASGSWDRSVLVWQAPSGSVVANLTGHAGWVRAVEWAPEGKRLASASLDHSLIVWSVKTGEVWKNLTDLDIESISWSPHRRLLAVAAVDAVAYDLGSLSTVGVYSAGRGSGFARVVKWEKGGKWLAVGTDEGVLQLWDASKELLEGWVIHSSPVEVHSISWSPSGESLIAGFAAVDLQSAGYAVIVTRDFTQTLVHSSEKEMWLQEPRQEDEEEEVASVQVQVDGETDSIDEDGASGDEEQEEEAGDCEDD
jgi:WD40 repeat protein